MDVTSSTPGDIPGFDPSIWASPLARWLRGVPWDSTSTLPSLSAVLDAVREELEKSEVLGVLFLRLERWGDVQDHFTWRELDDAYRDLSRMVSGLLGRDLRRVDLPTDLGTHGDGLAIILSAPRRDVRIDVATVSAIAERAGSSVWERLRDVLSGPLYERLTLSTGSGIIRRPVGGATLEDAVVAGLVEAEASARERYGRQLREMSEKVELSLSRRELSVTYQPVYELGSGVVAGFEAVLGAPFSLGIQHGDVLLDAASRVGLTYRLLDAYHEAALGPGAGDLASHEFLVLRVASSELLESAVRVLSMLYGREGTVLAPGNVVFLLDSADATTHLGASLVAFRSVAEMGFRLALDLRPDFPPSLDHLRELRPDLLRLGGRLVQGIAHRTDEFELVLLFGRFAARHGLRLLASGCTERAELLRLRKAGVALATGPYLAPASARPTRPEAPLP